MTISGLASRRTVARHERPRPRDPVVVVVAYHAPDLLDRCLATLGGDSTWSWWTTRPTPGWPRSPCDHGAGYVDPGRNLGFAGGVRIGCDRRDGRDVLLLNPDAAIVPDGIRALHRRLHDDPGLAAVAPAQHDPVAPRSGPGRLAVPHPVRCLAGGGRSGPAPSTDGLPDRLGPAPRRRRPHRCRRVRRPLLPVRRGDRLATTCRRPRVAGGAVPRGDRDPRRRGAPAATRSSARPTSSHPTSATSAPTTVGSGGGRTVPPDCVGSADAGGRCSPATGPTTPPSASGSSGAARCGPRRRSTGPVCASSTWW